MWKESQSEQFDIIDMKKVFIRTRMNYVTNNDANQNIAYKRGYYFSRVIIGCLAVRFSLTDALKSILKYEKK